MGNCGLRKEISLNIFFITTQNAVNGPCGLRKEISLNIFFITTQNAVNGYALWFTQGNIFEHLLYYNPKCG